MNQGKVGYAGLGDDLIASGLIVGNQLVGAARCFMR